MGYLNQICILVYFNIVIQNGGEVLSSIILPIKVLSDNAHTLTLKMDSYYPILTRMMTSFYPDRLLLFHRWFFIIPSSHQWWILIISHEY